MSSPLLLIKAIRSGSLAEVRAILDGGVPVEFDDGQGDPGLPLGMACFMGFTDIARELVQRGAKVNRPDNSVPTSPLSMAIRSGKPEVVKLLLELGAELPEGTQTGLNEHEVMIAQLKAVRDGYAAPKAGEQVRDFEEIHVLSCAGVDTQVLEDEALRAARNSL